MDYKQLNNDFAEAFANVKITRSPEEWKQRLQKMKNHPRVGKQAIVTVPDSTIVGRKLTVIRADDDITIFKLNNGGELCIPHRLEEEQVKWL